ncbi:helix-turn-helix domain-containing protein [Pedobacter nutrimenti]|jgi:AraC-like DNA-binding protein|uniref:AraC-like DNA-binding protein n=1 Tax=Pedobacter nutrimenti TaxID=1241337 RepID=A0A318UKX2_9SPHI|nr:AraC family transcriptional regulator [Pedobacter nutrimenti]PYF77024.1 AraC-like DNA-binding protein [Pedobacter nutrimenti]
MSATENIQYINYSCYFNVFREGEQFVSHHSLSMIISGEMELNDGKTRRIFRKGDVYFALKNHLLKFTKKPGGDEQFKSLSIRFNDDMLRELSAAENYYPKERPKSAAFIDLSTSKYLLYFMQSLLQYQDLLENRAPELLSLKQKEALLLLFAHDINLKDLLFDLSDPHKINLQAFMEKNFHFNVNLDRFAYLTGRSLATFKRDFEKIFQTSPRNWLQQKRLKEAYYLIKEKQQRPGAVYLELGFEDFSHFSFAFKKEFGLAPSELINT